MNKKFKKSFQLFHNKTGNNLPIQLNFMRLCISNLVSTAKRFIWLTLFILAFSDWSYLAYSTENNSSQQIKNVIIMIPDGMSIAGLTLARCFKGENLTLDSLACGLVKTYSWDSVITDSAAAATALATGFKTQNDSLGVLPKNDSESLFSQRLPPECSEMPVANIMEAARFKGLATGFVCTCEFMHATPAGFTSHYPSRKEYDSISEQQLYSGVDLIFAGGKKFLKAENRSDAENLEDELQNLSFNYLRSAEELRNFKKGGKVCGLFADIALAYEVDRNPEKEPSLAEMTAKALEILSQNEKGFILMVEGSEVDWAAHSNDPVALVHDILAFDEAVNTVLDFAKRNGNTAILALTDHGNGGISIGSDITESKYDSTKIEKLIACLKKARASSSKIASEITKNNETQNIIKILSEQYGIYDIKDEEISLIQKSIDNKSMPLPHIISQLISNRSNIGWTTHQHTGEDIVLFAYTPSPFQKPTGTFQNTEIASLISSWLDLDLKKTSKLLFRDASAEFAKLNLTMKISKPEVPSAAILEISNSSKSVELHSSKNYALFEQTKHKYPFGQNIYNGQKFYIPVCAIEIIQKLLYTDTTK